MVRNIDQLGVVVRGFVCPLGLLRIFAACLVVVVTWQNASAESDRHEIVDDRVEQLAEDLVALVEDEDLASSCILHFAEIETISGPFLTDLSFEALETAVARALSVRLPGVACEAAHSREPLGAVAKDVVARLSEEGRPSFVYTMSFFPKQGPNQMLLATAYRPNGRFAGFSGPLDIETVIIQADDGQKELDVAAPAAADAVLDRGEDVAPDATKELVTDSVSTTDEAFATDLSAIGTPEEIEAILAMKLGVMPVETKLEERPAIGFRIDTAGTARSSMIKELVQDFLLDQLDSSTLASVEEQGNQLRLSGQPGADLQGVEIIDGDPATAFDRLFRGDVDLILSTDPISQANHDRFAEAFGVDMRSGAGETIIGVEASGLVVHPNNQLQSLTKKVAAEIFESNEISWDQDILAEAGLSGPIQTLALAKDNSFGNGYAMRPDLILNENDEIAKLVSINPLSIGYSSTVEPGNHRYLPIVECGITYTSDDFYMRTEDHPFAKRFFLYSNPAKGNRFRNAFLFFATSDKGQHLIARHLVNLDAKLGDRGVAERRIGTIREQPVASEEARVLLLGMLDGARRLSTTFRFRFDSDELRLDQSAARDLANLIRLSQEENIAPDRLMVLGFADSDGDVDYNLELSLERAAAIAKRLTTYGVPIPTSNVIGFGEEAPIACNDDDQGKARNRRVEVWLREVAG